jgi:protein tyrosine/serine phosphatase
MRLRFLTPLFGTATVLALITGPVMYAFHEQAQMRNFRVVRENKLYRSGQMTIAGLKRAIHDYGIKTVISLRDKTRTEDLAEEAYCDKEEINYYRLPPRSWDLVDGVAPVDENVSKFLEIIDNPANFPILIHCFAGIHRSGAYCAIYRMEKEFWTNDRAIREVKACGYSHLYEEMDVLGYLEQYQPEWKKPGNPQLFRPPSLD